MAQRQVSYGALFQLMMHKITLIYLYTLIHTPGKERRLVVFLMFTYIICRPLYLTFTVKVNARKH